MKILTVVDVDSWEAFATNSYWNAADKIATLMGERFDGNIDGVYKVYETSKAYTAEIELIDVTDEVEKRCIEIFRDSEADAYYEQEHKRIETLRVNKI